VFVHGLCIPAIVVARTSLLQQHVGDARAGKVFALVYLTVSGMTALSAIVAGAIAARHGAPMLFLLAGGFGATCGLVGLLTMPRLRAAR
jgi:MFS family permease